MKEESTVIKKNEFLLLYHNIDFQCTLFLYYGKLIIDEREMSFDEILIA